MAEIITRQEGPTAKGSPLTNQEMDQNLINMNNELADLQENKEDVGTSIVMAIALG